MSPPAASSGPWHMREAADLVLAECVRSSLRALFRASAPVLPLRRRPPGGPCSVDQELNSIRLKGEQLSESHVKFREHTAKQTPSHGGVPGIIAPGATGVICVSTSLDCADGGRRDGPRLGERLSRRR